MPCQPERRSSGDATADRTADVRTDGDTSFAALVGDRPDVLGGLTDSGFVTPSPIQVVALPAIVAGNDTIVEAKNGTGKTLAFVVPTLMRLRPEHDRLQCVVLAPTREIAVQIQQCFRKVGRRLPKLKCEYFIGGTPVEEDKHKASGCQIAVGSPGRIKHLLNQRVLEGSNVKSFILDEVDRLFSDKSFINDIRLIDAKFPKLKQIIAVSASINKKDMSLFNEFMQEYTLVKGSEEDMNTSQDPSKFLIGIKQYIACVKAVSTNIILLPAKNVRLLNILQNLPYTQCIVFTNYMTRVEAVCNMLRDHNYKADYIRGDQDQNVRLKLVDRLTSFKSKILVATDLIARGIDSSNVDLVINMDCPHDWATYLHRIGRAGRYGNKGNVFTILDDDNELKSFKRIINSIENVKIKVLPIAIHKPIPEYADNELEDLDLTIESDVFNEPINENNIIEENSNKCDQQGNAELKCDKSESKTISNSAVGHSPDVKIKSIYGVGISEEESLERLRQVVKEREKELIDNNLINKKYLTNRSFVLFDPKPYLDDSFKYDKYTTEEVLEIVTKYDSNFEKYEAEKSLMSKNLVVQNDCENENSSSNQVAENECSEKSNDSDHRTEDASNNDRLKENVQSLPENNCKEKPLAPRFSNIYDLFQIPDFGVVKPTIAHCDDDNDDICSKQSTSNSCSTTKEERGVSSDENNSGQVESAESVREECDEESNYDSEDQSWIDSEESEEEIEWEEEQEEHENTDYKSDNSVDVVNSIYDECDNVRNYSSQRGDKRIGVYSERSDNQMTPTAPHRVNDNRLQSSVDYDVLNNWYKLWKQQMGVIQTCVRLSK